MTDQLSLLPMLDDAEHPTWLLNGNATENMHCIERCCSGIANIHEETF